MQGYSIATLHALADGQGGVPARAAQLNSGADMFFTGEGDPLLQVPRGVVTMPANPISNNQTLDAYMHEMHQRIYPQTQKLGAADASFMSEKQEEEVVHRDVPATGGLKMNRIKIIRSGANSSDK
jgi:hypothetical protein